MRSTFRNVLSAFALVTTLMAPSTGYGATHSFWFSVRVTMPAPVHAPAPVPAPEPTPAPRPTVAAVQPCQPCQGVRCCRRKCHRVKRGRSCRSRSCSTLVYSGRNCRRCI